MIQGVPPMLTTASVAVLIWSFLTLAPAWAVDIRDIGKPSYQAKLTRAYAPCLAPNDQTDAGVPACSPPVSSPCNFSSASIDIRAVGGEPSLDVRAQIGKLTGPGLCTTGDYTLQLRLRATADDPACVGGSCTFSDVTVPKVLTRKKAAAKIQFALEDVLPAGFGQANLEILEVTIVDPDGTPLATTGGKSGKSNLTLANGRCETPNTTGVLGPACAPPDHDAVCDFANAKIKWKISKEGLRFNPEVEAIVGEPTCRTGTYEVQAVVRSTGPRCGGVGAGVPCTSVDTPIALSIAAVRGRIDGGVTIEAGDDIELREIRLAEPSGQALAAAGVGYASRLRKPHLAISRNTLDDPVDDALRADAIFPNLAIDPTVGAGATFTLRDSDGVFYTVNIPAGLWQSRKPGRWSYRDDLGTIAGVRSATIQRGVRRQRLQYKVKLAARNVALAAADRPSVTLEIAVAEVGGADVATAARNQSCRVKPRSVMCR